MADLNQAPPPLPLPHANRRRRDKTQLSCTLCRRRKLRCDRAEPCGTCVCCNLSIFCTYVRPAADQHTPAPPVSASNSIDNNNRNNSSIADRIDHLEHLVTKLIDPPKLQEQISSSAISQPNANSSLTKNSHARINLDETATTYVDCTHWTAILDGIADLKNYLSRSENRHFQNEKVVQHHRTIYSPPSPTTNDAHILFGSCQSVTKEEVIAALPSREVMDSLVADYFQNSAIAPAILHGPTFLKEYEQFCTQPHQTSTIWIAVLLAVICLAICYKREPAPMLSKPLDLVQVYREKIIQCLVLGNYSKCPQYTIETLLLYLNFEYIRQDGAQIETWVLLGVIVRLALRSGYHKDASYFPNISLFQGEMRRRAWALILQLDTLISAQHSLPRTIRESQSDTAEPRNLLDDDLDPGMTVLPPSRPDIVHTPIQYTVVKNRVVSVYGMILDLVSSTKIPPYSEVVRLDQILDRTYATVPSGFHMRSMSQALIDSPDLILHRLYIALLFQKAKCVLHYWHMVADRTDQCYAPSRNICVEAALQILKYQRVLHKETQLGGCLHHSQWMISSLATNSFLLATILLCAELSFDLPNQPSINRPKNPIDTGLRNEIMQTLQNSHMIWVQMSKMSQEAQKAAEISCIVLNKIHIRNAASSGDNSGERINVMGTAQSSGTNPIPIMNDDETEMARIQNAFAWGSRPLSAVPAILRSPDNKGNKGVTINFAHISI